MTMPDWMPQSLFDDLGVYFFKNVSRPTFTPFEMTKVSLEQLEVAATQSLLLNDKYQPLNYRYAHTFPLPTASQLAPCEKTHSSSRS